MHVRPPERNKNSERREKREVVLGKAREKEERAAITAVALFMSHSLNGERLGKGRASAGGKYLAFLVRFSGAFSARGSLLNGDGWNTS